VFLDTSLMPLAVVAVVVLEARAMVEVAPVVAVVLTIKCP
jgi:hypothetical protein